MSMSREFLIFGGFSVLILGILFIDLLFIGRKSHVIKFRESIIWTLVWISFALLAYLFFYQYGGMLHDINSMEELKEVCSKYAPSLKLNAGGFESNLLLYQHNLATEFITGYLIEYTLSIDNVFVMLLILNTFNVREKYYKHVLFWGILGAIVLRFIFIFTGAALINRFEWILLIFGAFLVFSGGRMFIERNKEEKIEPRNHWMVKFLSKNFAVFPAYVKDRFFIRKAGKFYITPLFIVLMMIEFSDLIFAMDSIPAIFAVTRDPFIVFFSNIFAIIGLRSLFFLISRTVQLLRFLKSGIAILLVFVGLKLLLHTWLENIGFKTIYSLYIIAAILTVSILASVLLPAKNQEKVISGE